MKTKKFTLTKKSKTLISLGAAVALLAGLGVTLGETLTHKNNTKWTDATAVQPWTDSSSAHAWSGYDHTSTEFILPSPDQITNWYNKVLPLHHNDLSQINMNMIQSIGDWQKFSDVASDPQFATSTMELPTDQAGKVNFTPAYIIKIHVFVPPVRAMANEKFAGPLIQDHYLIMDENYNILDITNWNSDNGLQMNHYEAQMNYIANSDEVESFLNI